MSEHHIYPRWIFGPNYRTKEEFPKLVNDVTKSLCRPCHDEMEEVNRELQAIILRPFQFCFRKAFNDFMLKEKITNKDLFVIAMAGFVKVFSRSIGSCTTDIRSWLTLRMRNPGVSLRSLKEKRQ